MNIDVYIVAHFDFRRPRALIGFPLVMVFFTQELMFSSDGPLMEVLTRGGPLSLCFFF